MHVKMAETAVKNGFTNVFVETNKLEKENGTASGDGGNTTIQTKSEINSEDFDGLGSTCDKEFIEILRTKSIEGGSRGDHKEGALM